ncbi:MAG: sulfatase-like hydrolase/transferase [Clostridia bacterium]
MKKYDIFIMLTEDICPNFGCYGDTNAKTPIIDAFAKENIRFNYCSSAAPVCSAARTSLNLGMYGSCAGVGQHRSFAKLPDKINNIGQYMQEAGYFTSIGKTDFNFAREDNDGYDMKVITTQTDSLIFSQSFLDVVEKADKPIFMVQTTACTHQSQYGYAQFADEHRQSMPRLKEDEYQIRENVKVPDYHFTSPQSQEIWGQYHEKITTTDRIFGEAIDNLKKCGKYDDSIIFFAGDNGHGITQGKCELWDEGVHVPFLLHLPKELESDLELYTDEYGRYCDRLVSFIDFAPTCLSIAGAKVPEHMQGRVLFGEEKTESPNEIYSYSERVDDAFENSRCVREKDMLLTCDFAYSDFKRLNMYQTIFAPWFTSSMIQEGYKHNVADTDRRAFFRGMPRISEQMFNLEEDKSQLDNLAVKPKYQDELTRMRKVLFENIKKYRDGVFMPEPMCFEFSAKTGLTSYEIFNNDDLYPLDELISTWNDCVCGKEIKFIDSKHAPIKMMLTKFAADNNQLDLIKPLLNDESECVRAYVAFRLSDVDVLKEICRTTDNFALLMYISDLIVFWDKEDGVKVLEAILDKYFVNNNFDVNTRYTQCSDSAFYCLARRYGYEIDEKKYGKVGNLNLEKYTKMVYESLK